MIASTTFVAIYVRVSSNQQSTRSQMPDLERWAKSQDEPFKWFTDKATGKTMDRPGWNKLEEAIRQARVSTVVCWRIDRLGRTAKGLTALFEELQQRKCNLISLKEGINLDNAAGRLMANVLASVAQWETECRGSRIAAGIAARRAAGLPMGGRKKGDRWKVDATQCESIRHLRERGTPVAAIARALKLSRPTIYDVIRTFEKKSV